MANVSIKSANKYYGTYHAIRDVSVDIEDGEFVVLVGPSGCGKSTLLRMLAGLELIEDGDIVIGDRNVNNLPPKSRDIAMVFQNYALYPHMSVAQNMSFSLWLQRMPKAEIKARVDRAASILGLEALLERKPKQLSGGQRQRVAMGRAIVRDPQVFLFDEPLSNLDAKLRVQMRGEIRELHHRLRTTTIYVTHDQVEAMTMADKIVVMQNGVVEQIGAPLELYDKPANAFVAGFIGSPSMNFLDGAVENGAFLTSSGIRIPIPENAPSHAVRLGIRPEHMVLQPNGTAFELTLVEPTGSETQIAGKLGEHPLVGVFNERISARPGEAINVGFVTEKLHFFDQHGMAISGSTAH